MAERRTTRTALRATLKQEDAALAQRLPEDSADKATPPVAAVAPKKAAPARARTKVAAKSTTVSARAPRARVSKAPAATSPNVSAPVPLPVAIAADAPLENDESKEKNKKKGKKKDAGRDTIGKKEKAPKREKVVRDSFSMTAGEHVRLKNLCAALTKSGRPTTKSEVLRTGMMLIGELSAPAFIARLDQLPPTKGKRKK